MSQSDISVYLDPGSYSQEQIQPQALGTGNVPNILAVIGIAPRVKRAANEVVIRGEVIKESATFTGSPPYQYPLLNHGDRKQANTEIIRNGTDLIPNSGYSFVPAFIQSLAGPYNIPATSYVTFSMDKKGYISILIPASATQSAATVISTINAALVADPRYGVGYATAATAAASGVLLTSPVSGAQSDLRFIPTPAVTGGDVTTVIFGVSAPYIVPTVVQLVSTYYISGASYTISYVAVDTLVDPLQNSPVSSIIKIGNVANVTTYLNPTDYVLNSNNVDWSTNVQATLTGPNGTFNTTTLTGLKFAINGLPAITATLTSSSTLSAAAAVATLNAALVANANYGPLYGSVFSVSGSAIMVTAPSQFADEPLAGGVNSIIEFFQTPNNAVTLLFGISGASLPYQTTGSANQPTYGSSYFVTYNYTRPVLDYNNASSVDHRFFNESSALAYTGPITDDNITVNKLGQAVKIAFENGAPQIILIQINDQNQPGFPTINETKLAIDAAKSNSDLTDLVMLDTRLATQTYLLAHVTTESSLTEKAYRRGWYGMARNTAIGSVDSPGTLVYLAQVTLQVPPDSPGRGRAILSAPPNISKTFTTESGTDIKVPLDSTYLGVASAALMTSFLNVATSLLRKQLIGFDQDDFQIYQKGERRTLASNGVNVVTLNGGNFVLTDPVTTEQGAGNLAEFKYINAMAQKDKVHRTVDDAIDKNLVGITPTDLSDFIVEVKGFIADSLRGLIEAGDCARYRDNSGNARDINPLTDIQVFQSPSDPSQFQFRYWYNLRYTAKLFLGLYTVDNPFMTSPNTTQATS